MDALYERLYRPARHCGRHGVFAWLFWSTLGPDAFVVLGSLMVVVICTDNFRLRRQVKALQAGAAKKA